MDESIKRVANKTHDFTIIINEIFKRNDISARAKGIYAYIMTLPDNWEIHKNELFSHFTEGRDSLNTAFKELIDNGYIKQEITRDEHNCFAPAKYIVYESSVDWKPVTGNPLTGTPDTGNPQLLSTNSLPNTDKQKTNKDSVTNRSKDAKPSDKAMSLSQLLYSLHKENYDGKWNVKDSQIVKWAIDIDKLNRIDGREWDEIERVIRWVKAPGQFWADKIMSGSKLRDKLPTIVAQMKSQKSHNSFAAIHSDVDKDTKSSYIDKMLKQSGYDSQGRLVE